MRPYAQENRTSVNANDTEHQFEGDDSSQAWVTHAVREIQAGRDADHVQFGLIFRHFEPRCRRLLASLGLQNNLDDLVQETMWRVYRGIDKFRLESSFHTWLGRIVRNVARNAVRDGNTEKAKATDTSLDTLLESDPESGPRLAEPESREPNPLEVVLGAEREAELEVLLFELPPKIRQSMLLYYIHGFKPSEIADLQGTSPNTVKKQLVDGRKRIRPHFSVFVELFSLLLVVLLLAT